MKGKRASHNSTLDAIYGVRDNFDSWEPVLERIAAYIGGSGAMLVYNDFRNGGGFITSGGLRKDLQKIYLRDYVANSWNRAIAANGMFGRPILAGSLVDNRALQKTAFYADILGPQKIADMIAINNRVLSANGGVGGFGIALTGEQSDNANEALTRATALAPHLSRALDMSFDIAKYREAAHRLGSLLDAMPMPALFLDRNGRVYQTNSAAEATLIAQDALTVGSGMKLRAVIANEDMRLQTTIALALGPQVSNDGNYAISLRKRTGFPSLLVLTSLHPQSFPMSALFTEHAHVLVKIIDPSTGSVGRTRALRQAYALTVAEARVAELVASGFSTPEIAIALDVSASTVRTHLAACFDKTGLRSQVMLARVIGAI